MTQWLAATNWEERVRLRLPWDPWDGRLLPDEATIRRFLNGVDDQALAAALLEPPLADAPADLADVDTATGAVCPPRQVPSLGAGVPLRAFAVDGKTSRGARQAGGGLG